MTGPTEPAVRVSPLVVHGATGGTVLIAIGAFWLSFTALTDLATRAGIPEGQAWVWPLIVDGIIIVATAAVVALAPHGRTVTWYPWTLLAGGASVSIIGNATHAMVAADATLGDAAAAAISAVPPIVLLAITHLSVVLTRHHSPTDRSVDDGRAESAPPQPDTETDHRHGQAERLQADGWSNRQIARHLDVHPSTIGRWLRDTPPHH